MSRAERSWLERFRRVTVANLYVETAPLFGPVVVDYRVDFMPSELNGAFPIGPDVLITRVAAP